MPRRAGALVISLVVLAAAGLVGCGSDEVPVRDPLPSDEEVLTRFVAAEQQLDGAQLTAALGAGPDLTQAATGIRSTWDAARQQIVAGLSKELAKPGHAAPRLGRNPVVERAATVPTRDGFDFASMAWATWSLGLLYLGNDASGTVQHGPAVAGDVTTTDSTTVTAAKRGPVAAVRLSTTRTQTSRAGWSVSQTGSVELELPLCPDGSGVIAFDLKLELKTTGSAGTGARSTVTDVLNGRTVATVDDEAALASIQITGSYDHTTSAQGSGLAIAGGDGGIHVDVAGSGVTATTSGNATDAQAQEARGYGATLLQLAGSLAAARAGDYYEHGYCTEIVASPNDNPTQVKAGGQQPFDIRVRHKWEQAELTDRVTPRLDGPDSISPTSRTASPLTVTYHAPNEKNKRATIQLEARSRRGIARLDVPVKTPGGYAIHDTWKLGNGSSQKLDAVNCESPYGAWHVVVSGDLAANGWRSLNAFFDITADPNTGKGTVHGEEHSVTTDNQTYDGPSDGTVVMTQTGDTYLMKLEYDYDIVWHTPGGLERITGQDHIRGHNSRELHVVAATDAECPG